MLFSFTGCRYKRGPWSECDLKLQLQNRLDKIKDRFKGPDCPDSRVVTKKCETKDKKGKLLIYYHEASLRSHYHYHTHFRPHN